MTSFITRIHHVNDVVYEIVTRYNISISMKSTKVLIVRIGDGTETEAAQGGVLLLPDFR